MENASDALIMAGQVLIFIVALTICISSFTNVRAEVNRIVGQNEEIRLAKNGSTYINYIESKNSSSTRIVGSETLVSSMYRAIKEDYVIYIKTDVYNSIGTSSDIVKRIQATKELKTSNGTTIISPGDILIKVTIGSVANQNVNEVLKEELFNKIRNLNFREYLGEYQNESDSGVASVNKEVYRIITYVQT